MELNVSGFPWEFGFWIIDGLGIIKDETLSLLDERGGIVYVY